MGKVRMGVLAVTCTTCEDQVHCMDPLLCVYGVFLVGVFFEWH